MQLRAYVRSKVAQDAFERFLDFSRANYCPTLLSDLCYRQYWETYSYYSISHSPAIGIADASVCGRRLGSLIIRCLLYRSLCNRSLILALRMHVIIT